MRKVIITYSIFCIVFLYLIEQVFMMPYIVKTLIKIPMFLVFPIMIYKYKLKIKFSVKIKSSEVKFLVIWSLLVFAVIIAAYGVLSSFVDVSRISEDFSNRIMLSDNSVILAGIYTIFVNSFIEEVFFRGFIFQGLLKSNWNKRAYVYSAVIFATYHMTIFRTWFNFELTALIMFGLFIGGIIFSYFVKRTNSFLSSWIIHISADIAIILIGFKILNIFA